MAAQPAGLRSVAPCLSDLGREASPSRLRALDAVMDDDTLIAHSWNGARLSVAHGGPARVIVPKLYAWKAAKRVSEIVFLDRDVLGLWEVRGYSNTADQWTDDRFS